MKKKLSRNLDFEKTMKTTEILDLKFVCDDVEHNTIKDALIGLLTKVWLERESFNGKRPWGNSGWEGDFYNSLCIGGVVKCTYNEAWEDYDYDENECDKIILQCIKELGKA